MNDTNVEPVETPEVAPVVTPVATPEDRLKNSQEALKSFVAKEIPGTVGEEAVIEVDLTEIKDDEKPAEKPEVVEKPEKPEEKPEEVVEPVVTEEEPSELDKLKVKHKALNDDYANNLNLINHAAKHNPEILEEFYAKIAGSMMESKGLPGISRQEKPAEPSESHLKGQVNPVTEEEYTPEEIATFEKNFGNVADRLGLVKKSDIEADKAQAQVEKAQKTAVKNIGEFKSTWEEKTAKMGLNWNEQVMPAMSEVMAGWGITATDFNKITPKNLGDAFNTMMMSQPNGMDMIIANAKADALKQDKNKRTMGKVVPTKSTKPVGESGAETFIEQFKKADLKEKRRIAGLLIEQHNKGKGINNPIT